MTFHSYKPLEVPNAAFSLVFVSIATCQKPEARSSVENHLELLKAEIESSTRGQGKAPLKLLHSFNDSQCTTSAFCPFWSPRQLEITKDLTILSLSLDAGGLLTISQISTVSKKVL